jgi:S-DNA-T family DNA segregation ATPase FtsK/SpoIIIE
VTTSLEKKPTGALVSRPPAELVPTRRQRAHQAVASSALVPLALKTKGMAPEAPAARRRAARVGGKALLVRFPMAVVRGLVRLVGAWWRWVWCLEERDHARQDGKLHTSAAALRAEAKVRWIGSGIVAGMALVATLVAWLAYLAGWRLDWWWLALAAGAALAALAGLGRAPGVELAITDQRGARWLVDASHFASGLREAKLLGKDDVVRVVRSPAKDGAGWSTVVDLPGALKASSVIAHREDLAAAFNVDEECLVLERDRSAKGHASRLLVWSAEGNPFDRPATRFPLLDVARTSAWAQHPFGIDARGQVIELSLMWSSLLVGARPRRGKTAASRVAAAPFVLDPTVSIRCFDGKGGRDWIATRPICDQYVVGADDEAVEALLQALSELKRDVERGFALLRELPEDECPDNKVTEEITSNPRYKLPVRLVIIDELQNYITAGQGAPRQRGEQTIGEKIADRLVWLAKNGPALGVILLLITQRPSSESLPTELRSQIGTRFGLKVDDWRSSNMILGDSKNTEGYDCSKLLGTPGVGILVPDGELAGLDMGNPTLRTYYLNAAEWRLLCERGAELRGVAAGLSVPEPDDDIVEAEVVPHDLDAVLEAISEGDRIYAGPLGAALRMSPNALAAFMEKQHVEKRRDNRGKYYLREDVKASRDAE